ncbi:hypothetical protein P7C70_g487, partial [Phenoliferia sp. Uapishka_3]
MSSSAAKLWANTENAISDLGKGAENVGRDVLTGVGHTFSDVAKAGEAVGHDLVGYTPHADSSETSTSTGKFFEKFGKFLVKERPVRVVGQGPDWSELDLVKAPIRDMSSPASHIQSLFAANPSLENFEQRVEVNFRSIYGDSATRSQVPAITALSTTASLPPNGSFVRFRAMVQDPGVGNEVYKAVGSGGKILMYGAEEEDDQEAVGREDYSNLKERQVFFIVSVPGETDWVGQALDETTSASLQASVDRLSLSDASTNEASTTSPLLSAKFPVPSRPHFGCIAKLYGDAGEKLKIGDVRDFFGVLSETIISSPFEDLVNDEAHETAPATATALHVIFDLPVTPPTPTFAISPEMQSIRSQLVEYLADAVGGDVDAAEWILLALLGRIHTRHTSGLTLGSLSLNLALPISFIAPAPLYQILSNLLSKTSLLELSLPFLNHSSTKISPRSRNENLESGALQLSSGTTVVVDTRGIGEGKLGDAGQTSSALPSSSDSPVPAAYRSPASTSSPTDLPTPSSPQTFVNPYKSSRANQVNLYKLHVFSTRNNTILTLTHSPGSSPTSINNELSSLPSPHHPVAWVSAGSAGYKGAARGTYDAAVEASLRMFKKIEELVEPPIGSGGQRRKVKSPPPTDMEVIWKGFGQGRDAVFRSLLGGEGDKVRGLMMMELPDSIEDWRNSREEKTSSCFGRPKFLSAPQTLLSTPPFSPLLTSASSPPTERVHISSRRPPLSIFAQTTTAAKGPHPRPRPSSPAFLSGALSMPSPTSSTSSVLSDESGVASYSTDATSPCSPCSASILLNPLPFSPRKKTVLVSVSHHPSAPPAHFLAENPSFFYPHSPPSATIDIHSRSSSAEPAFRDGGSSGAMSEEPESLETKGALKFAPLPPGRRAYRSNSLSIGVAARAKMIQSQGGGTKVPHPRYAGPHQWYQTGGTVPPDVYTYKDMQKGVTKIWDRVRRRSSVSNTSRSSAEAAVMERDSKGKSKEIEHIEEASDEEPDSDDEDALDSDGSEDANSPRRGRPSKTVGLDLQNMGQLRTSSPHLGTVEATSNKGKGVQEQRLPTYQPAISHPINFSMSSSQDPPALPSIISRPSPRGLSPLRMLSFHEPSDNVCTPITSPTSPAPPTPSGILINRFESLSTTRPESSFFALGAAGGGTTTTDVAAGSPSPGFGFALVGGWNGASPHAAVPLAGMSIGGALARVASPDSSSASDASTDGWTRSATGSSAPSSAVGSPAVKATGIEPRSQSPSGSIATLTLLTAPSSPVLGPTAADGTPRMLSRSPSPHCKFAPLPKIDDVERPGTRRNSTVNGTAPSMRASKISNGSDTPDEQFALDLDDSSSNPISMTSANASLRLVAGSSVGFIGEVPSRRSSGSISGRSTSPSPRRTGSTASSRTHSPILSRHSSTDALHLHYVAAPPRSTRSSSRERDRAASVTGGEATRARDLWREEIKSPSSTPVSGRASPNIAGSEAAFNGLAVDSIPSSGSSSPFFLPSTNATLSSEVGGSRRTVFAEPPVGDRNSVIGGRSRPSTLRVRSHSTEGGVERDVFEVDATSGAHSDLDELEEHENEDGEGDEDDSEDEDADGNDRDGEGNEDDDDDDIEEDAEQDRKTARGAAVEVVHWHSSAKDS